MTKRNITGSPKSSYAEEKELDHQPVVEMYDRITDEDENWLQRGKKLQAVNVKALNRDEFLSHLWKLVRLEQEEEYSRAISKCSIEGLSFVYEEYDDYYEEVSIVLRSSRSEYIGSNAIKPGEVASIYEEGEFKCEGMVTCITKTKVYINVHQMGTFVKTSRYDIQQEPEDINTETLFDGIALMGCIGAPSDRMINVIYNEEPPLPPREDLPRELCYSKSNELQFFNDKLDKCQKEAVEFAIRQEDLAVIHGPPGTGKTTTIVEVIRQHIKMGVKVLALAPSNLAVDNLLDRLDDAGVRVIRVGNLERMSKSAEWHSIDAKLRRRENRGEMLEMKKNTHKEKEGDE